jgi:hypothetical protein
MITNNKKIKVMSKVEKIESLKQEKVLLEKRKQKVFIKKNKELTSFFKGFFGELPFHNIGGGDQDSFYFNVADENGFSKEIAKLYLRKSNWDKVGYDEVHINYYSTSTNSKFELNRLVTLGKIAKVVKEDSGAILDNHHLIVSKYNKVESKLSSKIWGIEKEIRDLYDLIQEEKAEKRKQKAFSNVGISFEKPRNIDLKNGYRAWNVENLRILGWVNEKQKSVDIEIKIKQTKWDEKTETYVDMDPVVQIHNKIRYQNVRYLVENA